MKTFVQTLYDYNFKGTGTVTEEVNSDEEDAMTIGMVSDSQLHGDRQIVGYFRCRNFRVEKLSRKEKCTKFCAFCVDKLSRMDPIGKFRVDKLSRMDQTGKFCVNKLSRKLC